MYCVQLQENIYHYYFLHQDIVDFFFFFSFFGFCFVSITPETGLRLDWSSGSDELPYKPAECS